MASGGTTGPAPARRSIAYPESGFYFFRSAWEPEAVFMPLKCAATGAWHNQPDNGTFELFTFGRNLMTDSGCYLYGSSSPARPPLCRREEGPWSGGGIHVMKRRKRC